MVMLSDLKLQEVRKVIMVNINGKICPITIKNLLNDKREQYLNEMKKNFEEGKKEKEINEIFYTKLFLECTDLVIDEDVLSMLENPSGAMVQVVKEILEILHELQCEMMLMQLMQLNTIEESLYAQLLILKSNTIQELSKENVKYRKEMFEKEDIIKNQKSSSENESDE